LGTPAQYIPDRVIVDVIDERDDTYAYVKFADGKCIWVKSNLLDFDDLLDAATERALDDDWGPENDDDLGFNEDSFYDGDYYDFEYDRP